MNYMRGTDWGSNPVPEFQNTQSNEETGMGVSKLSANSHLIDSYDKEMLSWIVRMHKTLDSNRIETPALIELINEMQSFKADSEKSYTASLLHPETTKGTKIPSQIPVPSASFQLHQSKMLTTNNLGHAAIIFNPYFLSSNTSNLSTFYVNNDNSLTGSAPNNNFKPVNIGLSIPEVYSQYRLVSGSIIVKYVGRLDIVQGQIGGAIIFEKHVTPSDFVSGTANSFLQNYGDFNLAEDSYFHQNNYTMSGIRELFFPLDSTYEQYTNLNTSREGFAHMVYINGATPNANAFKVDIHLNFECLPHSSFLNYIPTQLCHNNNENKLEAVKMVQKAPITAEQQSKQTYNVSNKKKQLDFWDKVGSFLPSPSVIWKLIASKL